MSQVQYLIDESVRLSVVAALRRSEPAIDVWRVGHSLRQLLDELLLIWAATQRNEWCDTIHYLPFTS